MQMDKILFIFSSVIQSFKFKGLARKSKMDKNKKIFII